MPKTRQRRSHTLYQPRASYFENYDNPGIFYTDDDIQAGHYNECRICL